MLKIKYTAGPGRHFPEVRLRIDGMLLLMYPVRIVPGYLIKQLIRNIKRSSFFYFFQ